MSLEIKLAYDELDKVRELFGEYTKSLAVDLDFQNYNAELAGLPDKYALPDGRLYIGIYDNHLAGCIALHSLKENCGEIKRLYVRPQFRGLKIGRSLVEKIIAEAKDLKYDYIVLDTFTKLKNSVALYKKMGFYEIEPYYKNPLPEVLFLRLDILGRI